jgi:membrane AbrB-like protein
LATDKPLLSWAILALASLALAWLFELWALPGALFLGPMAAAMGIALAGGRLRVPRWAVQAAQGVVGCIVAQTVTPALLLSIGEHWAAILIVVATMILAGSAVGWVFVRLGVLPGTTAAWGCSPGAAAAMVLMSEQYGADPRLVALMQYFRVIFVSVAASLVARFMFASALTGSMTAAAGAAPPSLLAIGETLLLIGLSTVAVLRGLRFPAAPLLLPLLLGGALQSTGVMTIALPFWLLALAYAAVGWYVGLNFDRWALSAAFWALPWLLASTAALSALCAGSAWVLTRLLHTDGLTAYLATSPGGLDSVTIIALSSSADLPLILALQVVRVIIVVLTGPQLARLIVRWSGGPPAKS